VVYLNQAAAPDFWAAAKVGTLPDWIAAHGHDTLPDVPN
jgi:hypothetical protein